MKMAERLDAALRGARVTTPELSGMVHAARQLELLKPVPPMPAADLGAARQAFMAEAIRIRAEVQLSQPRQVGLAWLERLKQLLGLGQGQAFAPASLIVTLVLVCGLVLGLGWMNRSSLSALPGDKLYSIKIFREDVSRSLSINPASKSDLNLHQVQTRSQEIYDLTLQGRPIPDASVQRLQRLLDEALRDASRLEDASMQVKLTQIRQVSLKAFDLFNTSLTAHSPRPPDNLVLAASAASHTVAMANLGLNDPDDFRYLMAAPMPTTPPGGPAAIFTPTRTAILVYPTQQPTLVVMFPTATLGVMLPPGSGSTPIPTRTPFNPTQPPVSRSATPTGAPTQTDPPPTMPTSTPIVRSTQPAPSPTQPEASPTPTQATPDGPQNFPTPTPVMQGNGE